MGWLCAENGFKHSPVPKALVAAADAAGKAALEGVVPTAAPSAGAADVEIEETTAATEEKTMEIAE